MLTGVPDALPAASAIVLRDVPGALDRPFELLMLQRHAKSSFMPNAWVFPGGMVEEGDVALARELADGSTLAAMRVAAVRETFEESGVWLGAPLDAPEERRKRLLAGEVRFRDLLAEAPVDFEQLVWTSRWITPVGVPKRFDTYFFLVRVPSGTVATAEQNEAVDVTWIPPAAALEQHAARTMQLVFPPLRNLEALTGFDTAAALLDSRRGAVIEPVQPILVDGKPRLP
jgi:8-oxo-dGTP pyrophosphatase MutT (NUDIX family)